MYHEKNLIINYIPRSLDDASLHKLFSSIGQVKSCRIIRDKNTKSSFGFGFCEYENTETAAKAIKKLNGYVFRGKSLKVSFAHVQTNQTSANLCVKGIPTWVSEHHLRHHYGQFGFIIQCRVLRDPATQESKCAAYLLFRDIKEAEYAKNCTDGSTWPDSVDGGYLSVQFVSPPHRMANKNRVNNQIQPTQPDMPSNAFCQQPNNLNYFINHVNQIASQLLATQITPGVNQQNMMQSLPQHNMIPQSPNYTSSIPNTYDYSAWPYSTIQAGVDLTTDPNRYVGIQQNYVQNQTHLLQQQPYSVVWPQQIGMSSLPTEQLPPQPHNMYMLYNNDEARNQNYVCNLNNTPCNINRNDVNGFSVYVYNIGNYMTELQLADIFAGFGEIVSVSIPKDLKTGCGKNFGFVLYNNYDSAKAAINSMNGFKLQERALQVSFKKVSTESQKKQTVSIASKVNYNIAENAKSGLNENKSELPPNGVQPNAFKDRLSNGGTGSHNENE